MSAPTSDDPRAAIVVNWNVGWARPNSRRGREIARLIGEHDPDVVCTTEGHTDADPGTGEQICATADYGYRARPTCRKVLLWSRRPWTDVDVVGHDALPTGRFVAGTTETPAGPIRVVGVCVPWRHAHVSTGRKDRRLWEDHAAYLTGLATYLAGCDPANFLLLGDFNQTIPRTKAPAAVWDLLAPLWRHGLTPVTEGFRYEGKPTIDHLLVGPNFTARLGPALQLGPEFGTATDHYGVVARLNRAGADTKGGSEE